MLTLDDTFGNTLLQMTLAESYQIIIVMVVWVQDMEMAYYSCGKR